MKIIMRSQLFNKININISRDIALEPDWLGAHVQGELCISRFFFLNQAGTQKLDSYFLSYFSMQNHRLLNCITSNMPPCIFKILINAQ